MSLLPMFRENDDHFQRFPSAALAARPSPIVQIQLVGDLVRTIPRLPHMLVDGFHRLESAIPVLRLSDAPITELLRLLRSLGATAVTFAFGLSVVPGLDSILSEADKVARAAILDVWFAPGSNLQQVVLALMSSPIVHWAVALPEEVPAGAQPVSMAPLHPPDEDTKDDQNPDKQWYLFRCHANRAWGLATGRGVVIADVDYGCFVAHPDLAGIEPGGLFNAGDGTADVGTGTSISHGTSVLGLAGAVRNGAGIIGFAPDAALWAVKAGGLAANPLGTGQWERGVDFVLAKAADPRRKVVIIENQTAKGRNIEQVPAHNLEIRQAISHGLVVVVAAGNGHSDAGIGDDDRIIEPTTGSILVGATTFDPTRNPRGAFSNFGPRVVVAAPGDPDHDVTCTVVGGVAGYRPHFGGTSGASPKVAGVCAMMLEVAPGLSHADVRDILNRTGSTVDTDADKPVGTFLDAFAAVQMARDSTMP